MNSSIAGETGCLNVKSSKDPRLLNHNKYCRLSLDVISLGEARRLSLDVISPDMCLC